MQRVQFRLNGRLPLWPVIPLLQLRYGANGYRIWNPKERRIVTVRDVIVDENAKVGTSENQRSKTTAVHLPVGSNASEDEQEELHSENGVQDEANLDEGTEPEDFDSCVDTSLEEESDDGAQAAGTNGGQTSGTRIRKPPAWQKDYDMTFAGFAFGALEYVDNLPSTVAELKQRDDWPQWQAAIQAELDSLHRNNTWDLVKLPEGRRAVSCKWVFRIKPGNGDEPDKYKARLVARGFSQRRGFDYNETYSPVARVDTLRTLLAVANKERMEIHQMDVQSAFLNGDLSEEIYMSQPEGYEVGNGLVCRLKHPTRSPFLPQRKRVSGLLRCYAWFTDHQLFLARCRLHAVNHLSLQQACQVSLSQMAEASMPEFIRLIDLPRK
ncbi:hypothetical protein RP20_CCG018998 [Aedes albopictus]|nr:hypothetical protein RP20_CCG018998 [Aedes albopictus]